MEGGTVEKPKPHHPTPEERDERVSLAPLEEALKGLLAVESSDDDESGDQGTDST